MKRKSFHLQDLVYGGADGIVTTFAVVAGVSGAELSETIIVILGLANVFADGFSMAAGNYMATKVESDRRKLISNFERQEIESSPEGEREEVKQIFFNKGLRGEVLENVVEQITANPQIWVNTMLSDEYGIPEDAPSPINASLVTFFSFLIFGSFPLLPFMLKFPDPFLYSLIASGASFILLGALKSIWSLESAWISALKTLGIGSTAALIAYGVGRALQGLT